MLKQLKPGKAVLSSVLIFLGICAFLSGVFFAASYGLGSLKPGRTLVNGRLVLETDQQFHELLLQEMPGLELTSERLGMEVVPASHYRIFVKSIEIDNSDPEAKFTEFVSRFEETGLNPVKIYFFVDAKPGARHRFFRVDFPGCEIGNCLETAKTSEYTEVKYNEVYGFPRVPGTTRKIDILEAELEGVAYRAVLTVFMDAENKITKYRVRSHREAITPREKWWVETGNSLLDDRRAHIPVYDYINNVALGLDGETFEPSSGPEIDMMRGL